jgi:predicted regulator of Ras-like GTPase activity (Roadblock/LC7/MglB family)
MSLDDHLREANSAVGVQGSFLVSAEGDVLAAVMPSTVEEAKLHALARHLARSLIALERSKRKTTELDLTFRDLRVLVRTVRPAYLALLCQRNANLPLINLSLGPVVKRIAAELKVKLALAQPVVAADAPVPQPEAALAPEIPTEVAADVAAAVPAEAPVARELSLLIRRQITEAQLIARAAGYKGIPVRVLGSAAVALHCTAGQQWMLPPSRNVLEFGSRANTASILAEVLQSVGFLPLTKFNESTGGKRMFFRQAESELWADIHCGAYDMYHRVEFDDVLTDEELVLPATQTFLVRLQTVEPSDADLRDLIAMLCDHEVSIGPSPDAIDATQITTLCADDWGWYRTAIRNLDRLRFLGSWARLPSHPHLRERIDGLRESIEHAPKSVRWQMRARIGDSVRWYKTPIYPPETANESAPG